MKVTKAIIPAAGLGTRMLPISKGVPKEMLPVVDKPVMQYLVEEAVKSGITDILIITNRGKEAIENYFDYCPDYETSLEKKGKTRELAEIRSIAQLCNISFLRQKEAKGLGHAVSCAKSFIGNDPFMVLYGDDMIDAEIPTTKEMIDLFDKYQKPVLGVQKVTREQIKKYSSLDATEIEKGVYTVKDMIEKPDDEHIITLLSILGRVLLTPDIFDILAETKPGAGNEIQLTDAMAEYARRYGMIAYEFPGMRHDMGSKLGFLKANVMLALKNPELGEDFKAWLKDYTKTL